MLIVEQGKVVDVCDKQGEYTYDMSTWPGIFSGSLGDSIGQAFQNIRKRFAFGGEAPRIIWSTISIPRRSSGTSKGLPPQSPSVL